MIETKIRTTDIVAEENGKRVGRLEFTLVNNEMTIILTTAYESGRGIGSLLMRNAVAWADAHRYKIIPFCSFAKKYLETIGHK